MALRLSRPSGRQVLCIAQVIAECNFSPARGFAMITDVGARNIASGYLAEVMEESNALPTVVGPM
jgi:hypothetical protein